MVVRRKKAAEETSQQGSKLKTTVMRYASAEKSPYHLSFVEKGHKGEEKNEPQAQSRHEFYESRCALLLHLQQMLTCRGLVLSREGD